MGLLHIWRSLANILQPWILSLQRSCVWAETTSNPAHLATISLPNYADVQRLYEPAAQVRWKRPDKHQWYAAIRDLGNTPAFLHLCMCTRHPCHVLGCTTDTHLWLSFPKGWSSKHWAPRDLSWIADNAEFNSCKDISFVNGCILITTQTWKITFKNITNMKNNI